MSAEDDDDLESDGKLDAMRTVWLSMRDEEPPDNGLAALMAAAREKADAMAAPPRESFWQKLLATFRRPPVLALASVAVLLGGALFIANRHDKMDAAPSISADQKAAGGEVAPAPPEKTNEAPATAIVEDHAGAAGSAAVESPPPPPAPPPVVAKEPVQRARPERRPPPDVKPPVTKQTTRDVDKLETEKPETPGVNTTGGLVTESVDNNAPAAAPPPTATATTRAPGRTAGADERPTAAVSLDSTTTTKDAGDSSRVLQLVKQCESAAARGDCAAVRTLAAKIRSTDADAYRQRVVKNTSIARCLE